MEPRQEKGYAGRMGLLVVVHRGLGLLAGKPLVWLVVLVWVGLWVGRGTLSPLAITPSSEHAADTYYFIAYQSWPPGLALGLLGLHALCPWTAPPVGLRRLRHELAVLLTPPLLFLILALAATGVLSGNVGTGALGRPALLCALLTIVALVLHRTRATVITRVASLLFIVAALELLQPTWWMPSMVAAWHPLQTPLLPIVGLMLALWLLQPNRALER